MTYINLPNLNNLNLDFNIIYKNDKALIDNSLNNKEVLLCNSLHHYLLILKHFLNTYMKS